MNPGIFGAAGSLTPVSVTPTLVTTITSGTGTFIPQSRTTWLRVTMVGGGGGGCAAPTGSATFGLGGDCGCERSMWIPAARSSYAVGAGGTAGDFSGVLIGGDGGNTTFGSETCYGGRGGTYGGPGSPAPINWSGVAGKAGNYGQAGKLTSTGNPSGSAIGYGVGGAGAVVQSNNGSAGTGGLLIVEEY